MNRFHIVYSQKDSAPVKTISEAGEVITKLSPNNHGSSVEANDMETALQLFKQNLILQNKDPEAFEVSLCYKVDEHGRLDYTPIHNYS